MPRLSPRLALERMLAVTVALAAGCGPVTTPARESGARPYLYEPTHFTVPNARAPERTVQIEVVITRPVQEGRHPAIVFHHGAPVDPDERRRFHSRYSLVQEWFSSEGYVVVLPTRQGFGFSEGDYAEDAGPCETIDYRAGAEATAAQIAAIHDHVSSLPYVDPRRIVVAGHSLGAFGALAFAARRRDLWAVLNFAGGRGIESPGTICGGERALIDTVASFGQTSTAPQLWIYSEGDRFFGPDLARRMFEAHRGHDASRARLVLLPADGSDGHAFPSTLPPERWGAPVRAFLASLGHAP